MDDSPPIPKRWFYIAVWLIVFLLLYGWQLIRLGNNDVRWHSILIDFLCILPVSLLFWVGFFAQFVLPVQSVSDRIKIVYRLLIYLFGGHGPAFFIRGGQLIMREGEERKKGPGVVWLDTASAALTRNATSIKKVIGPGVHFLEPGEYFAGIIDLHIQSNAIGPKSIDRPFEEKHENQSNEEYIQIQDHRKSVSALTRDGIEIVPNISITFRVDTGFPEGNQSGSRFGYRTGNTINDKANEKVDQDAIRKAILGEGINPNVPADSPRHRVAWNQLPIQLAVDVWREYAAKFVLDDFICFPKSRHQEKTAIHVINEIVKARLTQPEVIDLDDFGVYNDRKVVSEEFKLLQSRGLKVLSVGIHNFRFHPVVENTILLQWRTSWLGNLAEEYEQNKQLYISQMIAGQEKAIHQYAEKISANVLNKRRTGAQDTLKVLIMNTLKIMKNNEEIHNRLKESVEIVEQIANWVDESKLK